MVPPVFNSYHLYAPNAALFPYRIVPAFLLPLQYSAALTAALLNIPCQDVIKSRELIKDHGFLLLLTQAWLNLFLATLPSRWIHGR